MAAVAGEPKTANNAPFSDTYLSLHLMLTWLNCTYVSFLTDDGDIWASQSSQLLAEFLKGQSSTSRFSTPRTALAKFT